MTFSASGTPRLPGSLAFTVQILPFHPVLTLNSAPSYPGNQIGHATNGVKPAY
jgi:hypothetical protein